MSETIEKTEQRTLTLEKISATEVELKQLAADYKNYVVTESNLKEADEVRLKLYRPRIEIQRGQKANKIIIDKLYDENKNRAETLIKIIEPIEKLVESKIKVVKDGIAEKARQAAATELLRTTNHKNRIEVANKVIAQGAIADSEEKLAELKKKLEDNFGDHDFQEFKSDAQQILINANTVLKQRSQFLTMMAAEKAEQEESKTEHHPHEIVEAPDTPEEVKKFEKSAHPEYVNMMKREPMVKHTGTGGEGNVDFFEKWSYGGYHFGLDNTLDENTRNDMKACLTTIIDELPM